MAVRRQHLAGLLLALTWWPGPTSAQTDSIYRSTSAEAGRPLRLGVFATVSKTCEVGAPPQVKVVTAPKHGTLAVRSAKARTGSANRCPGIEVPVQAVIYQAHTSYSGPDELTFEVRSAPDRAVTQTIRIEVGRSGGTPRKPPDTPMDL